MLAVQQGRFSSIRQLFAERFKFIGNDAFQFFLWDNQLIIGHSDRFTYIFKSQFNLYFILFCAKYNSDRTVLIVLPFKTVQQGEIVVHLARIFGLEFANLQIKGNKATQSTMIKQHIHPADFSIILKFMLVANVCESATQFQQELLNFIDKSRFKFSLKNWIANTKKTEVVATMEDFIGKLSLCCR